MEYYGMNSWRWDDMSTAIAIIIVIIITAIIIIIIIANIGKYDLDTDLPEAAESPQIHNTDEAFFATPFVTPSVPITPTAAQLQTAPVQPPSTPKPAMDAGFTAILQQIKAERGFSFFENLAKCKSLLQDFTAGQYKKESRLLLLAIEAGCPGEIARSTEPEITLKKLVSKLHEEYSMDQSAAERIVDLLYNMYT